MIDRVLRAIRPIRYRVERPIYKLGGFDEAVRRLKNANEGQPMLVVGNGPSLNKTPLDTFGNVAAIGMNKINLLFDRVRWRPTLILAANGLVIRQNADFYRSTDISIHLAFKALYLTNTRSDNISFFLERTDRKFATDISKGCGQSGTITFVALQYAYYMGADPVIIVGVDHSFRSAEGRANEIVVRDQERDVDHFDPNYFAKGQAWGLPNLPLSEQGYTWAKHAFEEDGRTIVDATIGGKLEIFDKVTIDEAMRMAGV